VELAVPTSGSADQAAAHLPWLWPARGNAAQPLVLQAESFRHHIDRFNNDDDELYVNAFPNAAAWACQAGPSKISVRAKKNATRVLRLLQVRIQQHQHPWRIDQQRMGPPSRWPGDPERISR